MWENKLSFRKDVSQSHFRVPHFGGVEERFDLDQARMWSSTPVKRMPAQIYRTSAECSREERSSWKPFSPILITPWFPCLVSCATATASCFGAHPCQLGRWKMMRLFSRFASGHTSPPFVDLLAERPTPGHQ